MPEAMKTIIAVLIVIGLAVGAAAVYQRYDSHMTEVSAASRDWPSVSGLITRSNLEARRTGTGSRRRVEHDVEISYEYVVEGAVYRNDVVRFDQQNLPLKSKELLVSSHPVGKKVTVYYNPDKPKQSVLVRGSYP